MKKILFSILALTAFAYGAHAQTVTVQQGAVASPLNHSNTAIVQQKTASPSFTLTSNSSESQINVMQSDDGVSTGNFSETYQDGAYNYTHQIQSGTNNNTKLTQYNAVVGTSWGDGNAAYLYQAGEGNNLIAFQGTGSSEAGAAGNRLYASQSGLNGTLLVYQSSAGAGNVANLTQGAATEQNFQTIEQWGSGNTVQTTQVSGLGNYMFLYQENSNPAKAGNILLAEQRGGNGNVIGFEQVGSGNVALLYQNGNNNLIESWGSLVEQHELNHQVVVEQVGDDNISHFAIKGKGNKLTSLQYGSYNDFGADIFGENNTSSVTQTLNNTRAYIKQDGSNNSATMTQVGTPLLAMPL